MKKLVLIGLASAVLAGCVSPYTENASSTKVETKKISLDDARKADFGKYPSNYKAIVKSYYEKVAKDPDSIKYKEITKPVKFANNVTGTFDYLVCATINGKNSYGAYTGYSTDRFHIKNGKVVQFSKLVPVFEGKELTRALDEDWCHYKGDILIPQ